MIVDGRPAADGEGAEEAPPERSAVEVALPAVDAGDVVAEVTSFQGRERCVKAMAREVPPALAEVLGDIGYHRAMVDACKTREALATRAIEACDGLELRASRRGCQRRFAMYHGDPERCPDAVSIPGRDPFCLAVAQRDPSLCRAVLGRADIGRCRAIVLRNERPCRVAHETAPEAARCAAKARRWWRVIPPRRPRPRLPVVFEARLEICRLPSAGDAGSAPGLDAEATPGPVCLGNAELVRRGVVLERPDQVIVGGRQPSAIGPRLPMVELTIPAPAEDVELPVIFELGASLAAAWVELEPDSLFPVGQVVEVGRITLERFGAERGSIISGSFEVQLAGEAGAYEGRFSTFLRDVTLGRHPRTAPSSSPSSGRSDTTRSRPP